MLSLLLLEDHEHLGNVGDVVEVKPGYAHNYLMPGGIACPVTPDSLRLVERAKVRAGEERRVRAARILDLAKRLESFSLTFEERASEEGHLFGSVGPADIVGALAAQQIEIDEKKILLEHHLKELGIFNVPIRIDADKTVEIRVWVVEPGT